MVTSVQVKLFSLFLQRHPSGHMTFKQRRINVDATLFQWAHYSYTTSHQRQCSAVPAGT